MTYDSGAALSESVFSLVKRFSVTAAIIAALLLISAFPIHVFDLPSVRPGFALAAVYYWAAFRPATLSYSAVFILGLLTDLMTGGPIGLNAVTYIMIQWVTGTQRRFLLGQSFAVLWACFFVVVVTTFSFQWLVTSGFAMRLMSIRPVIVDAVLTGLAYPLMAWVLYAFNKTMAPIKDYMA